MNVRNCKKCNRIFNYIAGPPICPACKEDLEKKFQEVKSYIQEHRTVPLTVVAEDCDVDVAQLKQWVREERLVFAEGSGVGVECEICGVPIATGRFCDKCKAETMNDLLGAGRRPDAPQMPQKKDVTENPRMRFLDKK